MFLDTLRREQMRFKALLHGECVLLLWGVLPAPGQVALMKGVKVAEDLLMMEPV